MKKLTLLLVTLFLVAVQAEDKKVTVISAHSTADGKTAIHKELLEECIEALPSASDLQPVVNATSKFMREINGDPSNNDFVKMYSATIDINYMLYQKVMFIMSTNSVEAQEPKTETVEKRLKQTKRFESNSAEGDFYGNKSQREHFFSTPEKAIENAKKQAIAWLKQQSAVVCNK